jgi:hypothetical protein
MASPLEKPINPYGSVDKLTQLGLDPIAKAVEFIEQLELDIACMMFNPDGSPRNYSQVAYAQLMATKAKAINDLLRYGYSRVSEVQQVEVKEIPQLRIITTEDESFRPLENDDS